MDDPRETCLRLRREPVQLRQGLNDHPQIYLQQDLAGLGGHAIGEGSSFPPKADVAVVVIGNDFFSMPEDGPATSGGVAIVFDEDLALGARRITESWPARSIVNSTTELCKLRRIETLSSRRHGCSTVFEYGLI